MYSCHVLPKTTYTNIQTYIYTANVRSICPPNGIQILTSRLSCQCDGRLLRTQTVFI